MSKLRTIPNGLAGLRAMAGLKPTNKANTNTTIKKRRRVSRVTGRWAPSAKRCVCCGNKVGAQERASVLFKLANGASGEIAGRLCTSHKPGDAWRGGVGTIGQVKRERATVAQVTPSKPKLKPTSGYQAPKVWTPSTAPQDPQTFPEMEEDVTYTTAQYAEATGRSVSSAGKFLRKLLKDGRATRDESSKPYRYTING